MIKKLYIQNLILLLLAMGFFFPIFLSASEDCSRFLQYRERNDTEKTEAFKAYLRDLMENRVVVDEGLARLIAGLEKGELLNPILEKEALVNPNAQIQRKGLQEYIDGVGGKIDRRELLEWARGELAERHRVKAVREERQEETRSLYSKIEFHPVKGGKFKMGEKERWVKVELTHDIEVMSTPITQRQYARIMGKNPSRFTDGEDSTLESIDGKSIRMRPDNPVERVSWWDALKFANKLSEIHGFKPAYDLSEHNLREGRTKLRINAPEEDIYRAEGYRLPTDAEQEYILRAGGRAKGKYHFGNDDNELDKYAWYRENSNEETRPTKEKLPLIIDGREFYDVIGNVMEWGWDEWRWGHSHGKNPVNAPVPLYTWNDDLPRILRGGHFHNDASNLRSWDRSRSGNPHGGGHAVGFRLVRTIDNP